MSFQGDVAQIPLSNILQALLLNGQEGVLLLDDGINKHRLRVLKQGLRLLNSTATENDLLRRLLIKQRVLTESQLANVFSTWTPGSMPGGDFLLSRRILTRDVILTDVFRQIENTMLELVTNKSLKYAFSAGEDAEPYELFSPADVGQYLVLNPNAVLMEAVRREDEWARVRAEIPSPHMVFGVTDRGALSAKNLPVEARCLREIKPYLTGEFTIDRICQLTPLSCFEVHETLFKLKQLGLVAPLNNEQKAASAERLRRLLRNGDAIALLRSMLAEAPDDVETRTRLIALLEKEPQATAEVAGHFLTLATQFRQQQPDLARTYIERALELDPSNLAALRAAFQLAHASGRQRESQNALRSIANIAKKEPGATEAAELFRELIAPFSEDAAQRHELVDIYVAQSNNEAAAEVLQGLAELYKRRRDNSKLRKTCEQLARLLPSDSPRLRRANRVRTLPRLSWRNCVRTATKSALITGLCTALLVAGNYEYQARVAYASICFDVARHKTFGSIDTAKKTLLDLEATFPFSTFTRAAQAQLTELNRMAYVQQEERWREAETKRVQADSAHTRASLAFDSNELVKALELLGSIDLAALPPGKADEARALRQRIDRHFEEAKRLYQLSEEAERSNDYAASYQHRRTLCLDYSNVPLTASVRLPIRIETIPPGATVLVDGEPVGETPILLQIPWRKPPTLSLQRAGHKPLHLSRELVQGGRFNPLAGHLVRITLSKAISWQFDTEASIEVTPLLTADNLYVATRGGKVLCLSQDTGQLSWSYSTPQNMDISGGLGYWNGFVYFGAFDGRLYVLDTFTGKPASEPVAASAEGWPIKAAPSQPSERGVVAFNCDRRKIAAYSLHRRSLAWSFAVPDVQFLGQPQAANDHLYLCTTAGEIYVLAHDTGALVRKMSLGYELQVRGKLAPSGRYFVAGPASNLISLDPLQQQIDWSVDLPAPLAAPPTVEGDLLIVQTTDQNLCCLTTAGEIKWTTKLPSVSGPETEGAIFRSNYFLGTRNGLVLCHDLWTGALLWDYRTSGRPDKEPRGFIGAGVIGKGKLFIGSEDHFLYCLSIE